MFVWNLIWQDVGENFFGNSGRAEEPLGSRGEELIMSQTLESVLEEQEAIFRVSGVWGGRRVTKLGVSLVALWLADPGEFDFGCVIDNDIVARAHMERSKAIDEKLCKTNTNSTIQPHTSSYWTQFKSNLLNHTEEEMSLKIGLKKWKVSFSHL